MRIALAQINPTVGDLKGNHRKVIEYIQKAKKLDVDLVVFPEMVLCGYPPEDLLYKEHFVLDNLKSLKALSKHVDGISAILGYVDIDKSKRLYNAAAFISNRQIKGKYYKQELPNYGVFDEKRYFTPGKNSRLFSLKGHSLGLSICEDIWVEKGVCQYQARKGASVLINISCSPFDEFKSKQREDMLKKRAKQTGKHVCYINLVGGQDELVFDGTALIIDPKGQIVASGRQFDEDLVLFDLNLSNAKTISAQKATMNRKAESGKKPIKQKQTKPLNRIESIYAALVVGTRDYILKNRFKEAVIGLSGGIDSAIVATIAVDAIGQENVVGVTMPSPYTSKETLADAKELARNLGIKLKEIPIGGIFSSYLDSLKHEFSGLKANVAEENIQARIRGNILMSLSNKFGSIVLTTGNKSEVAVGYCTLYGDMSGGFAVIKDVSKTLVYELAKFRNQQGQILIPNSIIKRAPSAELRPNQKDQDTLPPYKVLDEMLKNYIQEHQSFAKMSKRNAQKLVKNILTLVDRNEYKRRQAPPGIKISPRAFGKDWRLPITNQYKEF